MNMTTPDLGAAYDEGAKLHHHSDDPSRPLPPQHPAPPASMRQVLRTASQLAAGGDLDRWLAGGARLLKDAQGLLARAEHEHATGRASILADAKMQLDTLQQRTREALRKYDADHQRRFEDLSQQIQRLLDMREAGEWPASD